MGTAAGIAHQWRAGGACCRVSRRPHGARASRFFWDTGAFHGSFDAILGLTVGIVVVVWTVGCIRDGRRYAGVAASAPWLGLLTGYGVGGDAVAMLAALGATVLAQIVVIAVHARAKPHEDHHA